MSSALYALDADQVELGATVRALLEEIDPGGGGAAQPRGDRRLWKDLAARLGPARIVGPPEAGGATPRSVELSVVSFELGRSLACVPFLSTVGLAASLLARVPDHPVSMRLLPRIAEGVAVATVALADQAGSWDAEHCSVRAVPDGGQWRLTGEKHFVLDGQRAEAILVVADTPDGAAVFAVRNASGPDADRPVVTPLEVLDQTRPQAAVRFLATPAAMLAEPGSGRAHLDAVRDLAVSYLAAEQAGGAERLLELVIDHVQTRVQFGRPIGSFQAVKHACADMLLLVESAKAAAWGASAAAAAGSAEFPALASLAKAYCSDAFVTVATEAIQLFGGLGFTWDHPAHRYFRRAVTDNQLFGDPYLHRELLAQRAGV
ncbi:acyl-CoA dehydrogenase family protein [uncultured Jatrophihabitans sp.]|uniref:acyl-CoA dehydrogenase family protein n=1 Tax=uncultured Jatrophihabitans sp. TaxID=1610747 RepID=UPI0035CAB724